jgi:hypothetical protein
MLARSPAAGLRPGFCGAGRLWAVAIAYLPPSRRRLAGRRDRRPVALLDGLVADGAVRSLSSGADRPAV